MFFNNQEPNQVRVWFAVTNRLSNSHRCTEIACGPFSVFQEVVLIGTNILLGGLDPCSLFEQMTHLGDMHCL